MWLLPLPVFAQDAGEEIVANLAAGRVVICVAKDGIFIGALENRIEPHTRPPLIVPVSSHRVAILLGAAEWVLPGSGEEPVRLDRELTRLMGEIRAPALLEQEPASDIEQIGLALLEPLRQVTSRIHRRIPLGPDETFLELLLVGYVENYGPEVWSLRYRVVQEPLRGSFWRTRVLRPRYTQLYPPEKGQPRTLIEVRYPPEDPGPALADLLDKDPRLARLGATDPLMTRAREHLTRGESHKGLLDDSTQLLRSALGAIAPPDAVQVVAVIREQKGLDWILAPPEGLQKAEELKPREPGAPTLRKKPN